MHYKTGFIVSLFGIAMLGLAQRVEAVGGAEIKSMVENYCKRTNTIDKDRVAHGEGRPQFQGYQDCLRGMVSMMNAKDPTIRALAASMMGQDAKFTEDCISFADTVLALANLSLQERSKWTVHFSESCMKNRAQAYREINKKSAEWKARIDRSIQRFPVRIIR